MQIKYKILKNKELLILKFIGEWSITDYKSSLSKVLNNSSFNAVKKVLSDFREVSSDEAYSQIKDLAEIREKTIKKDYVHVRLIGNPISAVAAHLYKEELSKRGYVDNYCSTIEHAIKLLNLDMKPSEIEALLSNLENKL